MVEGLSRAQPINEGTAAFITMKILPVPQTEPHQGNCLCWGSGGSREDAPGGLTENPSQAEGR